MTSNRNCSVGGCSNTYSKALKEKRLLQFYSFPSRPWLKERREKWITFVKRINFDKTQWEPNKYSRICSDHFVNGVKSEDPRSPSYNPTIRQPNATSTGQLSVKRYERLRKRELCSSTSSRQRMEESGSSEDNCEIDNSFGSKEVHCQTTEIGHDLTGELANFEIIWDGKNVGTYVKHVAKQLITVNDASVGPDIRCAFFGGFFSLLNEAALINLTGVSSNIFALLRSLFPNHFPRQNELCIEDKLLLTLMRMRHGCAASTLAAIFGIHKSTACKIFVNIISNLYAATKHWIVFPSKLAVKETMPSMFKDKFSNCRVIIDCTELKTECPPKVQQRNFMYSNYKSSYTAKYLIGISPNGLVSFLSKGYGGRATDAYITNDCGILNLLEPEDIVLADKGFPNIKLKNGTILVMPPFAKPNVPQFTADELQCTYTIASVRIHVERVIGRLKVFKILSERVSVDLLPHIDKVVHLCAVLINLSPSIVKDKILH